MCQDFEQTAGNASRTMKNAEAVPRSAAGFFSIRAALAVNTSPPWLAGDKLSISFRHYSVRIGCRSIASGAGCFKFLFISLIGSRFDVAVDGAVRSSWSVFAESVLCLAVTCVIYNSYDGWFQRDNADSGY